MKVITENYLAACGCRSVGECDHNSFAEATALDALIGLFSAALRKKLRRKLFRDGKGGWDDAGWTIPDIKRQAIEHIEKGDPIDVAAFAMFWWNKMDSVGITEPIENIQPRKCS